MAKILLVRTASALGMAALALVLTGLIPFLGTDPTAAGLAGRTPAVTVDRSFKGDRLPLPSDVNAAVSRRETSPSAAKPEHPSQIPPGCEAAFSPVSSPRLAYVYGRCMT